MDNHWFCAVVIAVSLAAKLLKQLTGVTFVFLFYFMADCQIELLIAISLVSLNYLKKKANQKLKLTFNIFAFLMVFNISL